MTVVIGLHTWRFRNDDRNMIVLESLAGDSRTAFILYFYSHKHQALVWLSYSVTRN